MFDRPRISVLASVALSACVVAACACPSKRSLTRCAGRPNAEPVSAPAPAPGTAWAYSPPRPTALSISGVVRDEQGRPIPFVWIEVEGFPETLKSPPPWRTDVHGRFATDDVPVGPANLLVTADDRPGSVPTKVVKTTAGARDLVIVLDPGPQLFVRIVGYVPGEQERYARVTWAETDGARNVRYAPIRADGWARFVALPPDRALELWAVAESGRRHVRARGLKPGPNEKRIAPHEVMDIAGTVRMGVRMQGRRLEDLDITVVVHAAHLELPVARVRPKADGSFRVRGLAPGTYLVDVGSRTGEIFNVSKSVEAGTTDVVFDL